MALKEINVEDIIRIKGSEVVTVSPDTTIVAAARLLTEKRIGVLIVRKAEEEVIGVLSERDIIRAVGEYGVRAPEMMVEALMTRDLVSCKPRANPHDVMRVMNERGFRHMPVVEKGDVKGLVSLGDLLRHLLEAASDEEALERAADEGMLGFTEEDPTQ